MGRFIDMEQWEIDLRTKLELELEDGYYQIGGEKEGDLVFGTGKGGAINYLVQLEKHKRVLMGLEPLIDKIDVGYRKESYAATEDDFIDLMKQLWKR